MGRRRFTGGVLFLLGPLLALAEYQYLLRAADAAAASPAGGAAFYGSVPGLIAWHVATAVCSVGLMAGGLALMLTGRKPKATPPVV